MTWNLVIWLLVGLFLFFFLFPTWIMAGVLYTVLLVRNKPEKWGRECSIPDDEEYRGMFDEGIVWSERYAACKRPVSVTSDGFRLQGEFFDFGSDRAVIIVPGRMESLLYSYYFAEPYRAAGWSVLVIDNRAHGLSEGKFCSLGVKECHDLLAWGKLLHEDFGIGKVVLHGICIGAAASLYALVKPDCPDYMAGMVADGMYTTFYESFKNHMNEDHHPNFPLSLEVMGHIRLYGGANVVTDGPIRRISELKKPILFLQSREDRFSLPEKAQVLYDKCTAPKTLRYFDKGAHSRIRVNAPEEYDRAVTEFLQTV